MLEEDIQYIETITHHIQKGKFEGKALMEQLIQTLARNLQIIAVVGSSKGCVELLTSFTNVISANGKRLDAMHEALIASLALAKDFDKQGVAEKTPIPKEQPATVRIDMTPFAAEKAIIKDRMSYHKGSDK